MPQRRRKIPLRVPAKALHKTLATHRAINLIVQQAAFEQEKAQAQAAHHSEPRPNLKTRVAYRVRTKNGTLVLCEPHLDKLRSREASVKYTGDTFAVSLCDHCHPELS